MEAETHSSEVGGFDTTPALSIERMPVCSLSFQPRYPSLPRHLLRPLISGVLLLFQLLPGEGDQGKQCLFLLLCRDSTITFSSKTNSIVKGRQCNQLKQESWQVKCGN